MNKAFLFTNLLESHNYIFLVIYLFDNILSRPNKGNLKSINFSIDFLYILNYWQDISIRKK